MSTIKSSAENLTLNADGANNDVIIQSNGSTKVTVDGQNSRVGIGTATPTRTLTVSSTGQTDLAIIAGTSASAQLQFGDSGDDNIGQIEYNNADNTMAFYTNATEAMEIGSSGDITAKTGDIVFGTAGKGICLGVTTNTDANTLDDYEEGTWTPVWQSGGTDPTISHSPSGGYVKIGNMVFVTINMGASSSASGGSSSNDLRIGGLPFAANGSFVGSLTAPRGQNWNSTAVTPVTGSFNASQILLVKYSAAYAAHESSKTSDLRTSGDSNQFLTSGFYQAA